VPPELGYPENDYNKGGPRPTTFSVRVESCVQQFYELFLRYAIKMKNIFYRGNEPWILF
jgi:hypothetical protein